MGRSEQNLEHIIPAFKDWPIRQFAVDRDNFVQRLINFSLERILDGSASIQEVLSKTIYLEVQRSKNKPWKVDPPDEKKYWRSLQGELDEIKKKENSDKEALLLLRRIVHRYSEEIVGDFNPKTYKFARKFLTALFKRLLNNGWGRKQKGIWGSRDQMLAKLKVDGRIDEIRNLFTKGTVVIVPTHYSNLDSILIGFGIDQKVGIPAFTYGAGLNLYDYELIAYFMHRLGAYRVDRRKKNPVYLETLKCMASLSLTEGVNHIFFPGGTRSRSGAIEEKLKLGLLNSVIDAQRHCILNDLDQKIFVVPLCIGYNCVLEASSLVEQHLRVLGKERYVRNRKRNSIFRIIISYLRKLRKFESEIHLSIGKPMDVLGNEVNEAGQSFDKRGKEISLKNYFLKGDVPNADVQRESVYTRILAKTILDQFKKENVVLASHFVAYVMYQLLECTHGKKDVFDLIKMPQKSLRIDKAIVIEKAEEVFNVLKANEDVKLSEDFNDTVEIIVDIGVKKLGIYHKNKVLYWTNKNELTTKDVKLLYYYHNKLIHYDIPTKSN